MKNIKLILSFCLLLAITFSCIKKKETNTEVKGATTAALTPAQEKMQKARKAKINQSKSLTPAQLERQKARRARMKNNQSKGKKMTPAQEERQKAIIAWKEKKAKRTTNKVRAKSVNNVDRSTLQTFKTQLNKPVTLDKNKGKFLEEINKVIDLSAQNITDLDKLIKAYQRKGMDLRFFAGFYGNSSKPFAKELSKIFTPLQVEQFTHFHAYWFDRIPYPKPDMPASLYYRLKLTKEQFAKVVAEYSKGVLSSNKSTKKTYEANIAKILNSEQKDIYNKILSISF